MVNHVDPNLKNSEKWAFHILCLEKTPCVSHYCTCIHRNQYIIQHANIQFPIWKDRIPWSHPTLLIQHRPWQRTFGPSSQPVGHTNVGLTDDAPLMPWRVFLVNWWIGMMLLLYVPFRKCSNGFPECQSCGCHEWVHGQSVWVPFKGNQSKQPQQLPKDSDYISINCRWLDGSVWSCIYYISCMLSFWVVVFIQLPFFSTSLWIHHGFSWIPHPDDQLRIRLANHAKDWKYRIGHNIRVKGSHTKLKQL